jgi:hypothetical protein
LSLDVVELGKVWVTTWRSTNSHDILCIFTEALNAYTKLNQNKCNLWVIYRIYKIGIRMLISDSIEIAEFQLKISDALIQAKFHSENIRFLNAIAVDPSLTDVIASVETNFAISYAVLLKQQKDQEAEQRAQAIQKDVLGGPNSVVSVQELSFGLRIGNYHCQFSLSAATFYCLRAALINNEPACVAFLTNLCRALAAGEQKKIGKMKSDQRLFVTAKLPELMTDVALAVVKHNS